MAYDPALITQKLQEKARALGFELFGVAAVQDVPELLRYREWIGAGYEAEMHYMARNAEKRTDPALVVNGAQSVIVCGKNYHTRAPLSTEPAPASAGWISRYAWGDDYHDVLKQRIRALYEYLVEITDGAVQGRYYVDTGPVLEKVWAQYAGLGWIGKNTCLINQHIGSYFFLAVIITDAKLTYSTPPPDRCGTCTRCIDACPTEAIIGPYVLDAAKCISYLTIELRDRIPESLRGKMGRHVFGCDICQDVCPWNRKAAVSLEPAFQPRPGNVNPDLGELLRMEQADFSERFRKSPVKRSKLRGLLRNALVAAGNSGHPGLLSQVEALQRHPDEMIQEHAKWAVEKLTTSTKAKKEDAYVHD